MKIVTLMSYGDRDPMRSLCSIWKIKVAEFCPSAEVVVLEHPKRDYEFPVSFNVACKLWNIFRQKPPFIFLDADAIPIAPLDELWALRGQRPLLAARQVPRGKSVQGLNSGVMLVSDTSVFDYPSIARIAMKRQFLTSGYDQAALYEYCEQRHIDWRFLDQKWNWNAGIEPEGPISIVHFMQPFRPWNNPACTFLLER